MTHAEKEKWLNEEIKISRREFADITSRLISDITIDCAKECDSEEELEFLVQTSNLIMHFTKDLMKRLFDEKTLTIEKEEK